MPDTSGDWMAVAVLPEECAVAGLCSVLLRGRRRTWRERDRGHQLLPGSSVACCSEVVSHLLWHLIKEKTNSSASSHSCPPPPLPWLFPYPSPFCSFQTKPWVLWGCLVRPARCSGASGLRLFSQCRLPSCTPPSPPPSMPLISLHYFMWWSDLSDSETAVGQRGSGPLNGQHCFSFPPRHTCRVVLKGYKHINFPWTQSQRSAKRNAMFNIRQPVKPAHSRPTHRGKMR